MKITLLAILCVLLVVVAISGCNSPKAEQNQQNKNKNIPATPAKYNLQNMKLRLKVNSEVFIATLADTPAVEQFLNSLPMTVKMKELHRNEKYYELPQKLPKAAYKPGTINSGDIMLFRSDILVVFYKTFQTSYEYTPIGRVTDVTGFEDALGDGDVEVTFENYIKE